MQRMPTEEPSMQINWKKEILTIPNLLSLLRLLLIPVYVIIYMNADEPHEYLISGIILAVSCLTDAVDGMIARQFNMISRFGKLLDPVADKLTQFTLTLCLSLKYAVLRQVLLLLVIKEIFQLIGVVFNLRRGKELDGALILGKICTVVLFVSLIALVLFPDISEKWVNIIACVDFIFLAAAFIQYMFALFGRYKKVHDIKYTSTDK